MAAHEQLYDVSLMVLAASEDKTYRGAFIASPTMAWVWGQIPGYNGPYHLVWARDLYQMATAEIAAGDRAAAGRALDYLWTRQQKPDGCLPQNSNLDGSPHWGGLQLDEVADPILLAWQLGRTDAGTWSHVQRAVQCILTNGPVTQERWENAVGYSPGSLAAEIAGLVGPTIDQRSVVDPSFLELVRLGVLRADDPAVRSTLRVVDRELGVNTPTGLSGTATTTMVTARPWAAGRSAPTTA